MGSVLHRRLARLEAALIPPPESGFAVLIEPDVKAPDVEWQAHRQAIEAARLRGDRVGVVRSSGSADYDQHVPDVEYYETEFHAWLAVMAAQKSQQGRANRLADVLASLNGSVLGVVTGPFGSEDAQ